MKRVLIGGDVIEDGASMKLVSLDTGFGAPEIRVAAEKIVPQPSGPRIDARPDGYWLILENAAIRLEWERSGPIVRAAIEKAAGRIA